MLCLRVFMILSTCGFTSINCFYFKIGEEIQNGEWIGSHTISVPFNIGGKQYLYGQSNGYVFIQKLNENGKLSVETDGYLCSNSFKTAFPFLINGKQFIYRGEDKMHYIVQEILPGGKFGEETDNGNWTLQPEVIFSFDIEGKHYAYVADTKHWFITELLSTGKIGSKTKDKKVGHFTLGIPFSIDKRQYHYQSNEHNWFIMNILPGGRLGEITDRGFRNKTHSKSVLFIRDGKQYLFGAMRDLEENPSNWSIMELLPGGKMGTEQLLSICQPLDVVIVYEINGRQFLYGVSEKRWFIREIFQESTPLLSSITKETDDKDNHGILNINILSSNASSTNEDIVNSEEKFFKKLFKSNNIYVNNVNIYNYKP